MTIKLIEGGVKTNILADTLKNKEKLIRKYM